MYKLYDRNTSCFFVAQWSDNFIVGLTNDHPLTSPPTLWNYTLCGQYPGAVSAGATVSLYCQDNLPPFRYVIVQFPRIGYMHVCEIEVLVNGTRMSSIVITFAEEGGNVVLLFVCLSVCVFVCLIGNKINLQEGWLSPTERASVSAISLRDFIWLPHESHAGISLSAMLSQNCGWMHLATSRESKTHFVLPWVRR